MPKKSGTGVIVGRFQVFELNDEHRKLVQSVLDKHERTIVFLGSNPAPSDRNPIDWEFRWQMFAETFGENFEAHEMEDLPDDRIWSQELDRRILELKPEGQVTLYGARLGFISRYSGRYPTEILEFAGEGLPEQESVAGIQSLRDFRAGLIYATLRRFPTVYPTVDIACFRQDNREVLLARKANETRFRFPGGFVDPADSCYEEAALRELGEECGELEIRDLVYVGSARIDDWRYRGSTDAVMTHFYACDYVDGEASAGDDITEIRWFEVAKIRPESLVPEHRPLLKLMEAFLEDSLDEY